MREFMLGLSVLFILLSALAAAVLSMTQNWMARAGPTISVEEEAGRRVLGCAIQFLGVGFVTVSLLAGLLAFAIAMGLGYP